MNLQTLIFLGSLLLIALWLKPFAESVRMPFSAILVTIGFLGSETVVYFGIDTGLRWHNFQALTLKFLVPILVFESAFSIHAQRLLKAFIPILFLALPAMVLAAGISGQLLFWGINHATGFPLITALLTGIILSATDPASVLSLFKKQPVSDQLKLYLEGESLLNDAGVLVFFGVFVALAGGLIQTPSALEISQALLYEFTLAILIGLAIGILALMLKPTQASVAVHHLMHLLWATAAFILAEEVLHCSGILAVLVTGLLLGERSRNDADHSALVSHLKPLALASHCVIFLLLGATVTIPMLTSHWLAILIAIIAVIIARSINSYFLLPAVIQGLPSYTPLTSSEKHIIQWGGLRGAVSAALALALPTSVTGWYSIQSIIYGVVLYSIFIQAPLLTPLLNRLFNTKVTR